MLPSFRFGLDISRHFLKGVYVCNYGGSRKRSTSPPPGILCTMRKRSDGDLDAVGPEELGGADYSPISLCYQGTYTILRPWNPRACVLAAGVQNQLLHFPVRPRSVVVVLGFPSLQTLSHLADILGPRGQLICVTAADDPGRPADGEELGRFVRAHPQVWVVDADIREASLEQYELLLGIPQACKYAFLMATHPRLGARSPANVLADARGCQRRILGFLEPPRLAKANCLVVCYCPPGTTVEAMRDLVTLHVGILQQWRDPSRGIREGAGAAETSGTEALENLRAPCASRSNPRRPQPLRGPHWVLLDLPTDRLVGRGDPQDMQGKCAEVVDCIKRLSSGARTGLYAKEQLLLAPYFPTHVLLGVKYTPHLDEQRRGATFGRRKAAPPHGSEGLASGAGRANAEVAADRFWAGAGGVGVGGRDPRGSAPAAAALPMVSFGDGPAAAALPMVSFGSSPPAEAPADGAPASPATGHPPTDDQHLQLQPQASSPAFFETLTPPWQEPNSRAPQSLCAALDVPPPVGWGHSNGVNPHCHNGEMLAPPTWQSHPDDIQPHQSTDHEVPQHTQRCGDDWHSAQGKVEAVAWEPLVGDQISRGQWPSSSSLGPRQPAVPPPPHPPHLPWRETPGGGDGHDRGGGGRRSGHGAWQMQPLAEQSMPALARLENGQVGSHPEPPLEAPGADGGSRAAQAPRRKARGSSRLRRGAVRQGDHQEASPVEPAPARVFQ